MISPRRVNGWWTALVVDGVSLYRLAPASDLTSVVTSSLGAGGWLLVRVDIVTSGPSVGAGGDRVALGRRVGR